MAKRRSNQEGTIYKRKDGKWRAQLTLAGRRLSKTVETQKEARDWLLITKNKAEVGFNFEGGRKTFEDFLEGWFVSGKSLRKPETIELYKSILRKNVIPAIGKVKMVDLRPDHIQRLYIALDQKGKSQHAIHSVHKILHTALAHAVKLRIIPNNPSNAVEAPARPQPRVEFLDDNQVQTFLLTAETKGDRFYPVYYLAIHTGMRQGELLGLKWTDIHWSRQTLNVDRQLIRQKGGGYVFRSPKTSSGQRQIAIGQAAITVLKQHAENQENQRKKAGERWEEWGLVFPSNIGTPTEATKLRAAFRKVLKRAGLPNLRFHDLRHTAASLMLNFGVPLIVVSKRLGHANPSITLNVYAHLVPSMQEKAAEIMDELLTPVSLPKA